MDHVSGPQGVACSREGDRCWYANDKTGEVCVVAMSEKYHFLRHHPEHYVVLMQPIDTETGQVMNLENHRAVQVYYPPANWAPFCIKGKLCPKEPGDPILLVADNHNGTRIIAMDTNNNKATVLKHWPDDDDKECDRQVQDMSIAYEPYPVVFATSRSHVERISLLTGASVTIHDACHGEPDVWQHGLVTWEDKLYVTKGRNGTARLSIIDRSTGHYVDHVGQQLLGNTDVIDSPQKDWYDILVLQSNPAHLILLDRQQDEIFSYRLTDGRIRSVGQGDGLFEASHGFNWLNSPADTLVMTSAVNHSLVVSELHFEDEAMPFSKLTQIIPLPEMCPSHPPKNTVKPTALVVLIVAALIVVILFFLWRRRTVSNRSKNHGRGTITEVRQLV